MISTPGYGRDPTIAHQIYELAAPEPRDVFVAASPSGINGSLAEPATPVNERGQHRIALTHALLPLAGGGAVCAVSSVTAAPLAQLLTVEVVRRFHLAGEGPPVHLSANVSGGNPALQSRYAGPIPRTA